jgi:hypothetical protein
MRLVSLFLTFLFIFILFFTTASDACEESCQSDDCRYSLKALSPVSQVFEGYQYSDCGSERKIKRDPLDELLEPALELVQKLQEHHLLSNLPLGTLLQGKRVSGKKTDECKHHKVSSPQLRRRDDSVPPSPNRHIKRKQHKRKTVKLLPINIHWHVVTNGKTGSVSSSEMNSQIHVLNKLCECFPSYFRHLALPRSTPY